MINKVDEAPSIAEYSTIVSIKTIDIYDGIDLSSDSEKIAIIDEILSSINQINKRIDENQKAINISKVETRVMLDRLKELTQNF
jgi:hypothetical protein